MGPHHIAAPAAADAARQERGPGQQQAADSGPKGPQASSERTSNATKRFATLQARAALAGVVLTAIEGDFGPELIVTWRTLTRSFAKLDEVESWLDRFAGKHGGSR